MNVLLLGAGGNAGNNYVECLKLGDPSIKVIGLDRNEFNLAACNSDVKIKMWPEGSNILAQVQEIVAAYDIQFIHAQPDNLVRFLLANPELSNFITRGNVKSWYDFADKGRCAEMWAGRGLTTAPLDLLEIDESRFDGLAAVGGGQVWIRAKFGAGSRAALPVSTFKQAFYWAEYWRENRGLDLANFTLAPFLPGPEFAVQTFWINGEMKHAQARERVEYFFANQMPSGQSSTPSVAKTVSGPVIYDTAVQAILTIDHNPHGIYCVDMKTDANGRLCPTEVNYGRYFTTSNFFAHLGMNTPYEELKYHFTNEFGSSIDELPLDIYWLRGLDRAPILMSLEQLKRISGD